MEDAAFDQNWIRRKTMLDSRYRAGRLNLS